MEEELESKKLEEEQEKKTIETIVEALTPKTIDGVYEKIKQEMPLRKNIFSDGSLSERQELADKQKQAADFLKAMERHDRVAIKALSSGTASSGLEMIPTYVSDQLIGVAQKYGLIRKYARKWPMQGINENIPTATTVTAYRLGSDTASVQASAPATGAVQLRAKTVGVIVPISKVLLQNSTVNLVDAIMYLAGKAIAKLEDQWGFLGINANEGIFQNTSVPVTTMALGGIAYKNAQAEDLLSVIDSVDENFIGENMRWIMSHSVLNNFRRLRSTINSGGTNYLQGFLLENLGGEIPSTLWDIPYDTSAVMPKNSDSTQNNKNFLALADYDNIIFGDAMEYTMEMSDQATVLDTDNSTLLNMFQQNMVALKIWGLVDIQLSNPSKAHGILKTSLT